MAEQQVILELIPIRPDNPSLCRMLYHLAGCPVAGSLGELRAIVTHWDELAGFDRCDLCLKKALSNSV